MAEKDYIREFQTLFFKWQPDELPVRSSGGYWAEFDGKPWRRPQCDVTVAFLEVQARGSPGGKVGRPRLLRQRLSDSCSQPKVRLGERGLDLRWRITGDC